MVRVRAPLGSLQVDYLMSSLVMRAVAGDHGHHRDPAELEDEPAEPQAAGVGPEVHGWKIGDLQQDLSR